MATGFTGGYGDGGYDAAYDDEYPTQQPYPHPGIRGLQYGGDGRQYAAGGIPGPPQWGYEEEGYGAYGDEEVEDLDNRMDQMTAEQRQAAMEAAQRSQSSKRYQEMERERKRRQLKTAGGAEKTSFFQATKLSLMNSGLIPLKKGNTNLSEEKYFYLTKAVRSIVSNQRGEISGQQWFHFIFKLARQ